MKTTIQLIAAMILLAACSTIEEPVPTPSAASVANLNSPAFGRIISTTPASSLRGDAVFSLIVPDNNYGGIEDAHLYSWTQNGQLNVNRVALDFNLDEVPTDAVITKASISLYFNPTSVYNPALIGEGHYGDTDFLISRITSEWREGLVTWNTQPSTTSQNQVYVTTLLNAPTANYVNLDVTDLVQALVNEAPEDRYGLMLQFAQETPYKVLFFASSDHAQTELHPKLVVAYY